MCYRRKRNSFSNMGNSPSTSGTELASAHRDELKALYGFEDAALDEMRASPAAAKLLQAHFDLAEENKLRGSRLAVAERKLSDRAQAEWRGEQAVLWAAQKEQHTEIQRLKAHLRCADRRADDLSDELSKLAREKVQWQTAAGKSKVFADRRAATQEKRIQVLRAKLAEYERT